MKKKLIKKISKKLNEFFYATITFAYRTYCEKQQNDEKINSNPINLGLILSPINKDNYSNILCGFSMGKALYDLCQGDKISRGLIGFSLGLLQYCQIVALLDASKYFNITMNYIAYNISTFLCSFIFSFLLVGNTFIFADIKLFKEVENFTLKILSVIFSGILFVITSYLQYLLK